MIFIGAQLVETNLENANLTGCHIYGISAWNLKLEGAQQKDLIITNKNEPVITVDNLEVAQFIYLLLHNQKIRTSSTHLPQRPCWSWATSPTRASRCSTP